MFIKCRKFKDKTYLTENFMYSYQILEVATSLTLYEVPRTTMLTIHTQIHSLTCVQSETTICSAHMTTITIIIIQGELIWHVNFFHDSNLTCGKTVMERVNSLLLRRTIYVCWRFKNVKYIIIHVIMKHFRISKKSDINVFCVLVVFIDAILKEHRFARASPPSPTYSPINAMVLFIILWYMSI